MPIIENMEQYWVKVAERENNYDLHSYVQSYDNKFYWDNFSNENLYKSALHLCVKRTTINNISFGWTTGSFELTPQQANSITGYSDLRVRLKANSI